MMTFDQGHKRTALRPLSGHRLGCPLALVRTPAIAIRGIACALLLAMIVVAIDPAGRSGQATTGSARGPDSGAAGVVNSGWRDGTLPISEVDWLIAAAIASAHHEAVASGQQSQRAARQRTLALRALIVTASRAQVPAPDAPVPMAPTLVAIAAPPPVRPNLYPAHTRRSEPELNLVAQSQRLSDRSAPEPELSLELLHPSDLGPELGLAIGLDPEESREPPAVVEMRQEAALHPPHSSLTDATAQPAMEPRPELDLSRRLTEPPNWTEPTRPTVPLTARHGVILPGQGSILQGFGDLGTVGERTIGLVLRPVHGAPILAPLDGTIRYAGWFANLGLILIIEHEGGYHSLIAGLGRIDVEKGQDVLAGEPVAYGQTSDRLIDPAITLYYELRYNGRPINPIPGLAAAQQRGRG